MPLKNLRCKRITTEPASETGIQLPTSTTLWTKYLSVIPENLLSIGLRQTENAIYEAGKFTIIHGDATLDVKEGDLLTEVDLVGENDNIFRVITVQRWERAVAILIESTDQ